MGDLAYRQVHLDFHTSEKIGNIGTSFSKEQFQKALKLGHVNSITVFSKCHHGWAYHPSKANEMHPGLNFDLLGEMITAAHEIGVKTPVYLSAGFDEKMALRHPEWLFRDINDKTLGAPDFMHPGYHVFCMNSPYLDYFLAQIEEVAKNYDADGFFLDIMSVRPCYCHNCLESIKSEGKDPNDINAMKILWERTYANYAEMVRKAIDKYKPGLKVFHNGGHIVRGRRDLAKMNTHLELESLPTGGWGYDHFPLSAAYARVLDMDFLGMTGKFHTSWGEFGGFKHPNALRYEASLSIANGARCSIGDQLHPEGFMDEATYSLIGAAYKEVEEKEEWLNGAKNLADIALLSLQAVGASCDDESLMPQTSDSDAGAVRMLLEGKLLFDVIDLESDFNKYKLIILPDNVRISNDLKKMLEVYLKNGGKILATGQSGLNFAGDKFEIDLGVKWERSNPFKPDYFRPSFELKSLKNSAFVCYSQGQRVLLDGGKELGKREDPYFNREAFSFCSHQHTPNSFNYGGPGMVECKNGIYIAWNIFEDYAAVGSLALKESVLYAINTLLPKKTIETSLPAQGIVTLTKQEDKQRYINHLLYVSPVKRGQSIEVIEDIIPLYNIDVKLKIDQNVKKVYLAPQMIDLPFETCAGGISYVVPKLECHQMIVVEV